MKKAVLYARVSSDQQKEEKTIESQLDALKDICKRDNVSIVKEYIDDGWGGETLARPALDQLRDEASLGLFNTLYVWKADRLGRDHIDQGIVLRELKKQEIKIFFGERQLTEENKLQSDIESLLAEYENKQRAERTRRGKLYKIKSGKFVRTIPPFGYKFIKTKEGDWKLEINPKEAEIVKAMFNLYLKYQRMTQVAKDLERRKIYTRNNIFWKPCVISKLLGDKTYKGEWHFGKIENVEPKNRKLKFIKRLKSSQRVKPEEEWIKLKIPAIIDEKTFERVQELKKKNFKLFGFTKNPFILSGLLRCDKCGLRVAGFADKRNINLYSYYRCPTIGCGGIKRDLLDSSIWDFIKNLIQNPEILIQYIKHLNENRNVILSEETKTDLLRKKSDIKKKKDRLFSLYEEEVMEKDELMTKIRDYAQKEKEIDNDIKEVELKLFQAKKKDVIITNLQEFAKLTENQLNELNPRQKKEFLRIIIKEIRVNFENSKVDIGGHIPISEIQNIKEINELWNKPVKTLRQFSE
ncbi:recombinase family protein [Patescibacteria group bacterium]